MTTVTTYKTCTISKSEIMCIQCQGKCVVKDSRTNTTSICPMCTGKGFVTKKKVADILGKVGKNK